MYQQHYLQVSITGQTGNMPSLGMIVLSTDFTSERDYALLARRYQLEFDLYINRMRFANPMTPESLRGTLPGLQAVAEDILPGASLDAILFNCTSASALLGDRAIREVLEAGKPHTPVLTTASASVAHIRQQGHKRVSLLAPYCAEVSRSLADYFERSGLEVAALHYMGITDDREVAKLSPEVITDAACRAVVADCDALFISCTNTRAVEILAQLEKATGVSVYSSNSCSFWQAMQVIGLA